MTIRGGCFVFLYVCLVFSVCFIFTYVLSVDKTARLHSFNWSFFGFTAFKRSLQVTNKSIVLTMYALLFLFISPQDFPIANELSSNSKFVFFDLSSVSVDVFTECINRNDCSLFRLDFSPLCMVHSK